MTAYADVEEYLAALGPEARRVLEEIRARLHSAVPDGVEAISYGIPALKVGGRPVVFFAGWAHHVSVYPLPSGDDDLAREMAPYVAGRGTLKFPLDRPVPLDLVERIGARLALQQG